jgi:hypothetical protein
MSIGRGGFSLPFFCFLFSFLLCYEETDECGMFLACGCAVFFGWLDEWEEERTPCRVVGSTQI